MKTEQLPIRNWFLSGLSLILFFTILSTGYLFLNSGTHGLQIDFSKFKFDSFGLVLLMLISSWLIESSRISFIVTGLGERISFFKVLEINLATAFTGNITPFYSGGIPTQIYLLCKTGLSPGKSSAVVTMRVILSTLVFTILTPFLLLLYHTKLTNNYLRHVTSIAIPIAFALAALLLLFITRPRIASDLLAFLMSPFRTTRFHRKLQPIIIKLFKEIEIFQNSIKEFRRGIYFYLAFLFSILYWSCFFAIAPCLMSACGIKFGDQFWQIIFFQFILVFMIAYIPIPSGSGVMELGLYSVFSFIPPGMRALFIFAWRLISYHIVTFVGGIILIKLINKPVQHPAAAPE